MGAKTRFNEGSVVDFKNSTYSVFGIIKSLNAEKATLEFRTANQPKECGRCGASFSLSMNGSTGEIQCMATGCGHKHGFKVWEEEHLISELIMGPEKFQQKAQKPSA